MSKGLPENSSLPFRRLLRLWQYKDNYLGKDRTILPREKPKVNLFQLICKRKNVMVLESEKPHSLKWGLS